MNQSPKNLFLKPSLFDQVALVLTVLLFCAATAIAAPDGDLLGDLLKEAQSKNHELISAAAEAQRYQTRVPLLDNLSDPILAFYYLDFPIANMGKGWSARESEEVAGPATLVEAKARRGSILTGRDMVEDMALWYKYLHEDLVLKVRSEVRQAFYQVYYLDEIIRVTEQSLATLDNLIETSNASYAVGKVRQQDVLRTQVERYQLQADLIRLRQDRLARASRLNYLTGRYPGSEIVPLIEPELTPDNLPEMRYTVENLVSGLYTHKPLIKGYQALGGRFKAMRSMVQMYFNREVQDEAVFEADSGFRAISAKATDYYNGLMAELQTTAGDLGKSRELAGLYAKVIVPQGRQAFEAGLADVRVGSAEYTQALNALLALNRDQTLYYRAMTDYMVDLARLEELSGVELHAAGY